jgi:hypothetical protein
MTEPIETLGDLFAEYFQIQLANAVVFKESRTGFAARVDVICRSGYSMRRGRAMAGLYFRKVIFLDLTPKPLVPLNSFTTFLQFFRFDPIAPNGIMSSELFTSTSKQTLPFQKID